MASQKKTTRISKEAIKQSALNNIGLDTLENAYGSGAKQKKTKFISPRNVSLIAAFSTVIVFVLTFGSVYTLYALVFGSEQRLAIIGLDDTSNIPFSSAEQAQDTPGSRSSQNTTSNTPGDNNSQTTSNQQTNTSNTSATPNVNPTENQYCLIGSLVPDQVCQAILSVEDDKSITNQFITTDVVKQIEPLPASSRFRINEQTWTESSPGNGTIEVEVLDTPFGDLLAVGTLQFINSMWTITNVSVVEIL